MRATGVLVIALVVLANVVGWAYVNRTADPLAYQGTIAGVGFSPYKADQNPQESRHPSPTDIEGDLKALAGKVTSIRSYSATDGLEVIPALAAKYGYSVMAGAWIDGRKERNEREIENLIAMTNANPNVNRVLVGNEVLMRADIPVQELIQYIRRVRAEVKVPVSTAEPWAYWLLYPELAGEVDFIAIHLLPYWEGIATKDALDEALSRYQQVKNAFPNKPVVIAEIGWPSDGRVRREAAPSPTAQATFIRDFLAIAKQRRFDYYIMEAFDQPWKREIEGSVGPYWGIWNADRTPKFPLSGTVDTYTDWGIVAGVSSLLALIPLVWFLRRFREMALGGQLLYGLMIQGAASVFAYVILRSMVQYMPTGVAVMWAVLVPLLLVLLGLMLAEGLEAVEVAFSKTRRLIRPARVDVASRAHWRKVSIHVPSYNEPPELMKRTLDALARLDYPNFEVIVVDNNTKDEAVWRPVQEHCRKLGDRFKFYHVAPLTGFKSGALNFALRHTAPDAEVIGIIDSDYIVEADWLKSLVPTFDDAKVGFVQSPQDHYDWADDRFKEAINWEYAGFFDIGMVQRNERDAIIQHGTMTLIRRAAMDEVGHWAEWCICEDSELGLRLIAGGYTSHYTNHRFGHGVTPDSMAGYKSQRFRWAYGAMQILKGHWREMLPWKHSHLTPQQRYHYVAGWAPWVADSIGLVFAVASLLWTVGVMVLPRYFDFPTTMFMVPALGVFALKVVQFMALYAVRVDCTWRQRFGAGLAGLALTYTIAKATLYGIFTSKLPFIRTPKAENQPAFVQAFMAAREESVLCVLLWLAAFAIWQTYGIDDPESKLWSILMLAQSVPYLASFALAVVNTLPARKAQAVTAPAASDAIDQTAAS